MFETSQQEQNSGMGKTVGGVIAVAAVLMVAGYYMFLREEPGAQPAGQPAAAAASAAAGDVGEADPMQDLVIMGSALNRDQTQTMAMWDFQLANRSRSLGYRNIQYATNYYGAEEALLYHNEGSLPDEIEPGDRITVSQVNDGLYPVGTVRYTIEIQAAEAFVP